MARRRPEREPPAEPDHAALEELLGHRFADRGLLRAAVMHPSIVPASVTGESYERLEFLGDRVLALAVSERLIERFPQEPEGALTHRLVALVQRDMLLEVALEMGLRDHIRIADGGAGAVDERTRDTALADGCEAIMGALYLDGGLEPVRRLVDRFWGPRLASVRRPPRDPKTALQEHEQGRGRALPSYRVIRREGPPHRPVFTVEVSLADGARAEGVGGTKRAAEAAAAERMLGQLTDD